MYAERQAVRQPFGELLRRHRVACGLSQETLAELSRLSVETISALERGVRQKPYLDTIALLSDALQLSQTDRTELERAASRRRTDVDVAATRAVPTPTPHNLPAELSSFVGREHDVADIEHLMTSDRLVTLVGAGGVGKTRIAMRVASNFAQRPMDGVWFIDLATVTDASFVPNAIAAALGIHESTCVALANSVVAFLKDRKAVLVFDNCEHVVAEAANAAEQILRLCPRLQILATSREMLGITGERSYHVPSLERPAPEVVSTLSVEKALTYDAIALFVDRAKLACNQFALTEQNVSTVAEICRQLDGVPLAIEIAAARISVLSAATLAQRLNERFLVLTGGSRNAPPRHKTMRALLDWSYDLLNEDERRFLRRLSVYVGGFTLELATPQCSDTPLPSAGEALELLSSLVDKSLIQAEISDEATRYRLLESTRQYALEKLREQGEYADAARLHALTLLALAERYDSRLELTSDDLWNAQFAPEIDNWRTALEWALGASGDLRIGQHLAGALRFVFRFSGLMVEGLRWVRRALATCGKDSPLDVQARLELAEIYLAALTGQFEGSVIAAERVLSSYERIGDRLHTAEARCLLGVTLIHTNDVAKGKREALAALEVSRDLGAVRLAVHALNALAQASVFDGDFGAARDLYGEMLATLRDGGVVRVAAIVEDGLAEAEFNAGDREGALRSSVHSVETFRTARNRYELANSLCHCSGFSIALGHLDEGRAYALEALQAARDAQSESHLALSLQHLAAIAMLKKSDFRCAASLLGFVEARFAHLQWKRDYSAQQERNRLLSLLKEEIPDLDALMTEGSRWAKDKAIAEALAI
jgi:predicted ATPase/transcriptional regulator with XRE-family HTH domain